MNSLECRGKLAWPDRRIRVSQRRANELQMALDKFAKLVPVVAFHVHKFDTVATHARVANHSGEMDFPEPRTDFQFDGVSHAEFFG